MSIRRPVISVLTPVWNGLPYIKECVDSVLKQDFQDWEYIISDNGSTDGTRDYLDTLNDPRIRVFKQEKNLGIDGNLNFLFSTAKSELAYCLCADDYFHPGALGKVVDEWKGVSPDAAYIIFNWNDISIHSKGRYSHDVLPHDLKPSLSLLAFYLFGNLANNLSNVSTRVSAVLESGGFDENYRMAGDLEIWVRLAKKYSIHLSDLEAVYVRRHKGAATTYLNKQGRLMAEQVRIYEDLYQDLSKTLDKEQLIEFFNIDVCSFHFREAIRAFLFHGRTKYLQGYYNLSSHLVWPKWKRILRTLPFAISEEGRMNYLVGKADSLIKASLKNDRDFPKIKQAGVSPITQ